MSAHLEVPFGKSKSNENPDPFSMMNDDWAALCVFPTVDLCESVGSSYAHPVWVNIKVISEKVSNEFKTILTSVF